MVSIHFTAAHRGPGPLTWGQRLAWSDSRWLGSDDHYYNLTTIVAVPPGRDMADVADALRALILRHEALRTRFYVDGDDEPVQEVPADGVIEVEVAQSGPDGADALADEVRQRLRGTGFRLPDQWPVRLAVVTDGVLARYVVLVFSHIAVDGGAVRVVAAELDELLTGPAAAPTTEAAPQPLDRATFEVSEAGQRMSQRALDLLARELSTAPQTMFPATPRSPAEPRFWRMEMRSPAATIALRQVAVQCRTTTSNVLLAAVAVILGTYARSDRVMVKTILGNRGFRELRDLVCVTISNGHLAFDVSAGTFTDLVRTCASRTLLVQARGQCDPRDRSCVIAGINEERGINLDLSTFFNDFRGADPAPPTEEHPPDLDALCGRTRLSWIGQWERQDAKFFFHVVHDDDCDPMYVMIDSAFIPLDDVGPLLLGLERLVVHAVRGPVRLPVDPSVTGVPSPRRDEGWRLVDGCWIRPDDVRALLRAAVPDVVSWVAPHEKDGRTELVAYLAADGGCVTPETVHEAVMAELPSWPTAVAPTRYVVCSAVPAAPESADAWRSVPITASGTGRRTLRSA